MLARKYEEYAWEEQRYEEAVQPAPRPQIKKDPYRCLRARFLTVSFVLICTYMFSVVRSEAMVEHANQLVSLRKTESALIKKNNELKIEVEQLKGPERIIGMAERRLGMSVARNNIYVKAALQKNNNESLTVAAK